MDFIWTLNQYCVTHVNDHMRRFDMTFGCVKRNPYQPQLSLELLSFDSNISLICVCVLSSCWAYKFNSLWAGLTKQFFVTLLCTVQTCWGCTFLLCLCFKLCFRSYLPWAGFCLFFPVSIYTVMLRHQVWQLPHFFLFPFFSEKSLICLEGKSMTPYRGTLFSSVPPSNSLVSVSDPRRAF